MTDVASGMTRIMSTGKSLSRARVQFAQKFLANIAALEVDTISVLETRG